MPRLFVPALVMSVALSASGAELGEVSVRSHIGQQLSADIELVDLTSADLADVQVRLASPDVFAGARVAMNPALAGLNLSVFKDGTRRVLHLTTLQPVNAELVHIFFELSSGGRQIVRTASLWLTREPAPARTAIAAAPAPASVSVAAVASAAPAGSAAPAALRGAVAARASAATADADASTAGVVAGAAAPPSARASSGTAPGGGATGAAMAARPVAPSRPSPDEAMMKAAAVRSFAARRPAPAPSAVQPVAQPARLAMAPVRPAEACSPALVEERAKQCAAMDASNKELTSKLGDLEGKVKRLQSALSAAPAVAVPSPAAATKVDGKPVVAKAASSAVAGSAAAVGTQVEKGAQVPAPDKPAESQVPAAEKPAAPAQTVSGAIKDARTAAANKPAEPPNEAIGAKAARAASAAEEEKPKKMSRPRLISLIAGGALGLLALIGVAVHLVRKRRTKGGPLKIWQSFRKKDKDVRPVEPVINEVTENVPQVAAQE